MTPEQQQFLKQHNIPVYIFSHEDLILLQTIIEDELYIRQDIRNKELKLKLAQEVEKKTGNDQGIETLKSNLFLSRKNLAKRLSDMDELKDVPGYIERDYEGKIIGASEDYKSRLDPIEDEELQPLFQIKDETPHWQVSIARDDGTEEILGVQ